MHLPVRVETFTVLIDHHTLIIHGDAPYRDAGGDEFPEEVAAAGAAAGLGIASDRGVIALVVPVQTQAEAPVRVELWESQPNLDEVGRDFLADIDLDICAGRLVLQGGGVPELVSLPIPDGDYRMRFSGWAYHARSPAYRVQLWERDRNSPEEVHTPWAPLTPR